MGKRRKSREIAVQMLYQHDLGRSRLEEVYQGFKPEDFALEMAEKPNKRYRLDQANEAMAYARTLFVGAVENRTQIDELIESGATNWRLVRMSAVDRSILRTAVYELLFEGEVPQIVVVDEAIELAKRFGSEQSASFVNGVLDGLLRKADFPGTLE
jgi:N utilization substance protein B